MKRLFCSLLLVISLGVFASAQAPKVVTAKQANGTYKYRNNQIQILALGHNKLRIGMDLIYEYRSKFGLEANEGSTEGEATIENDTATFHPPDYPNCTITIKFLPGNRL